MRSQYSMNWLPLPMLVSNVPLVPVGTLNVLSLPMTSSDATEKKPGPKVSRLLLPVRFRVFMSVPSQKVTVFPSPIMEKFVVSVWQIVALDPFPMKEELVITDEPPSSPPPPPPQPVSVKRKIPKISDFISTFILVVVGTGVMLPRARVCDE